MVLGNSTDTNGNINILVLKYNSAGNLLWTYSYDGPAHGPDRAMGIRLDAVGNIHVAGTSSESGEESSVAPSNSTRMAMNFGRHGRLRGILSGVTASGLDLDSSGNVVTVGTERAYGVTWKYDANGHRLWMGRYRAEEPAAIYAVAVRFDGNGDIITAANLYGGGVNDSVLINTHPMDSSAGPRVSPVPTGPPI